MTTDHRLVQILEQHAPTILLGASRTLARCHLPHYDRDGPAEALQRLDTLYRAVLRTLESRQRSVITEHAVRIARERLTNGYGLRELQTAFNALEEAIWSHLLEVLPAEQFAEAIGLVSTVIGTGKDAMVSAYASFSSEPPATRCDLDRLFKGTEGA